MNRARFVFSPDSVFAHLSLLFGLCFLSLFNTGCSRTDNQECEPYSNLNLAQLDSAIAHFEVRVANGAHEQSLFDSLGEAYLRRVRIDQSQLLLDFFSTDRKALLNPIFHNTEKAELLLHRAIDQDPNDLMAKKALVEVLLEKLRVLESFPTVIDSGFTYPPVCYQTINQAHQLAQSMLYSLKDSVMLWRPMADLYNLAGEFTVSDATYHDSARVFIALKLSEDKNDPIALFYSGFVEWWSYNDRLDRAYVARKLLRSNLTYPYILTVLDESREFYFPTGGMTTWLDRLESVPKIVKFSYGQGFRFKKTAYSHEDKLLITKKIESAHLDYPDDENVLQKLIRNDIANGRMNEALEEVSKLIARKSETQVSSESFTQGFYKDRYTIDTAISNRFIELVKKKDPDNAIIDYTKAYTVYVSITRKGLAGVPLSEFSVTIRYLNNCLQKNEGFLPAYDLLLKIWCHGESDSLARSVFHKWNNPENILQKMVTIARERGGVDLDGSFYLLTEYYMKQKQYELVIDAANRFKASDGISDVTRISRLGTLCGETKRTDFLKRFLEKNLNIDRNALALGWEILADYSLEHNDNVSAEKYYRKAREIVPSRIPSPWINAQDLFVKTGQYNKIISEHNRYNLSWWPYIKRNHDIFAWAYHKLGQEAKADSILNEIIKVAPKSASALVVKAAIAYDKGKTDEVRELLKSATNAKEWNYDVDAEFHKLTKKQK